MNFRLLIVFIMTILSDNSDEFKFGVRPACPESVRGLPRKHSGLAGAVGRAGHTKAGASSTHSIRFATWSAPGPAGCAFVRQLLPPLQGGWGS
jgi:hypothetical protein